MQFRKDEGMNSLFSISLSVITRQVLNTFESVNSGIFHHLLKRENAESRNEKDWNESSYSQAAQEGTPIPESHHAS